MNRTKILLVDDEPEVREAMRLLLRRERKHSELFFADSAAEAITILRTEDIQVLVSDL